MTKQEWNKLSYGEKAWKLNLIIAYMNDEEAYYSGWLYIWPDGESYAECLLDFAEKSSYQDLEKSFKYHYSRKSSHKAGLFSSKGVPQEVVEVAHFWDKKLGLEPITVLELKKANTL